jgi:hypothetical protein
VDRNAIIFCALTNHISRKFSNKFILEIIVYFVEGSVTKKSRLVREQSSNGDIHLIFQGSRFAENRKNAEDLDEAEIKVIMKKEASKPLLILREE